MKIIKEFCNPSLLVMIIFRPTKGTVLENCKIPNLDEISVVVKKVKEMFPDKDISLGCIRPRLEQREEIELAALQAGVNRMEIPSKNTLKSAEKMGYTIRTVYACCALPEALEDLAVRPSIENINRMSFPYFYLL